MFTLLVNMVKITISARVHPGLMPSLDERGKRMSASFGEAFCIRALNMMCVESATNWTAHLFKNDVTPDGNSVLGDFTECDFDGYDVVDLQPWDAATWNGGTAEAEALPQATMSWLNEGAAQDIYGVYFTDENDDYAGAARFDDAPITLEDGGAEAELTIDPRAFFASMGA